MNHKLIIASFILIMLHPLANMAQKTPASESVELYNEILTADQKLFTAFNNCDTATYRKFIKDDIEFYHDLGGLNIGADYEMKSIEEMCARGNHIRRELVKSSLEVHPIKGYGAIEIGIHNFYHTNKGQKEEKFSGTYKFVQIWEHKDGLWKLARVISYGHNEVHND
ncbi:nuclear transport factor 2 family protein [Flavobacterium kingsejongi]|uniref:DUF4440 domain-containing protein n=1 Tax=Flavobacterium kingsejongi TaxID=1678728 RepID=A0A2S1LJI5_9FLAO|nr:nuclear transport factor 2 family protein [Flavobacterium kingsejongi]AWG23859.1 hypothetical protein FK004_00785 [Flavobacterium kingsejongi]